MAYSLTYSNFRLLNFESDSFATWIIAALGTDHGYYWAHRMMHECNIIWAAHQVHHSGEDFNLAASMRQSLFQRFFTWPFYLPLAVLGIPPQFFLMHMGLNLMYQFWIHTELIDGFGPVFNYFFNTPKHHQVHHGRNPYCVDKNYGGTLIIWDRIYGTFADRDADVHYEGEKIAYGLIPPINSFGFFKIQLHSYKKVLKKFFRMTSFGDKFKALWYGPGWSPKINPHLRMGDPSELPKITKGTEKKFHNPKIGMAMGLYAFVQLSLTVLMLDHFLNVQVELMNKGRFEVYSLQLASIAVLWFFWSLSNVSEVVEGQIPFLEVIRCFISGVFFIKPEFYGERVQLPELLAIPFLLSAVFSVILRIHRNKIKSN